MPFTIFVANLWISSRWLISATRYGKQTGITDSRYGRTKVSYNGVKANFKRFWENSIIMSVIRIVLFAASMHWAEEGNTLSVWTLRSLTNLYTVLGVPNPLEEKDNLRGGGVVALSRIDRWVPCLLPGPCGNKRAVTVHVLTSYARRSVSAISPWKLNEIVCLKTQ